MWDTPLGFLRAGRRKKNAVIQSRGGGDKGDGLMGYFLDEKDDDMSDMQSRDNDLQVDSSRNGHREMY